MVLVPGPPSSGRDGSRSGRVHLGAARIVFAALVVIAISTGLLLGLTLLGVSLPCRDFEHGYRSSLPYRHAVWIAKKAGCIPLKIAGKTPRFCGSCCQTGLGKCLAETQQSCGIRGICFLPGVIEEYFCESSEPRLLWRRNRNAGRCLTALLWATIELNRRGQRNCAIAAAVVAFLAGVRRKGTGEQICRCKVAQRVSSWTNIRTVTANLETVIDLSAAWPSLPGAVETVFSWITVEKRDAAELPVHLKTLVPARTDDGGKAEWTG
jgi:hypothetical protein